MYHAYSVMIFKASLETKLVILHKRDGYFFSRDYLFSYASYNRLKRILKDFQPVIVAHDNTLSVRYDIKHVS